jgi:hypothetical protein
MDIFGLNYLFYMVICFWVAIAVALLAIGLFVMRTSSTHGETTPRSQSSEIPFREKGSDRAPDLNICHAPTLPTGYTKAVDASILPLTAVINSVISGVPYSSGLYSVTFSESTLTALKSGDAHLMHSLVGDRAVTVGLNGQVTEIGHVVSRSPDTGRFIFATASVFTGQYFLARIDQKLQTIVEGVEEIFEFLDSSEAADLRTALNTLYDVQNSSSRSIRSNRNQRHFLTQFHDCLKIMDRNLSVLEETQHTVQPPTSLSATEKLVKGVGSVSNRVSSELSKFTPSKREDVLRSDVTAYSSGMLRGISALQACMCLDVLLDVGEVQAELSPISHQLSRGLRRFQSLQDEFSKRLIEKTKKSLDDWRFTSAEERRARLREYLDIRTRLVDKEIESAKTLESLWATRRDSIPGTFYCNVDRNSRAIKFFLPDHVAE